MIQSKSSIDSEEFCDWEDGIFYKIFQLYMDHTTHIPPWNIRNVVHNAGFNRREIVDNLLHDHYRVCFDSCRFMPPIFLKLCTLFRESGLLRDTKYVFIEEQMAIFLQTLAHGEFWWDTHSNSALQGHNNKIPYLLSHLSQLDLLIGKEAS